MSVSLRLRRMGRKQHPIFGLVAADSRAPRDGRFIEDLGRYEPVSEPAIVKIDAARVIYWLSQGAQPSHTVHNLLQREGILYRWSLERKGESEEAIEAALTEFKERQAAKGAAKGKKTNAERRAEALQAERAAAKEKAAELAKARAEREAELQRQREEAEAAARAEAEEARAATAAAAADNEALTEAADAPAAAEETQPEAEAATEAPAEEAAEAQADEQAAAEAEGADEAVAETTEETVAEEAPDAAEEQPAVEEATPEAVADDAGEAVADQTDAATEAPAEEAVETEATETSEETPAADAASGDDLTIISGIGPKYSEILTNAGITTYAALAETSVERLQEIITEAGSTTAGNEETWAEQARAILESGDEA